MYFRYNIASDRKIRLMNRKLYTYILYDDKTRRHLKYAAIYECPRVSNGLTYLLS